MNVIESLSFRIYLEKLKGDGQVSDSLFDDCILLDYIGS